MKKEQKIGIVFCLTLLSVQMLWSQTNSAQFVPGAIWPDNNNVHINAHGGGILYYGDKYYWFGEHKSEKSNNAFVGVTCYTSDNLYNWKFESVALPVSSDTLSEIAPGCIIERPKVIYNKKTNKFVMYFHLELKGKGYSAARVGIAVSDKITGTYKYLGSCRPNAGYFPVNMTEEQKNGTVKPSGLSSSKADERLEAVQNGLYVRRDFEGGQMSRDMTLYVDDNGKAYHIFASEENQTLHLAELSDDYLSHTGKYYMITSGCTGWRPNAARLFTSDSLWGTWTEHPNPCVGEGSDLTFRSQSTYILPVRGKKDAFIFMGDRWTPNHPIDGRYIWLPILFENGLPTLKWFDSWDLSIFDSKK